MGIDNFWAEWENYRDLKRKGFSSRTTGCSCCSNELTDRKEIRKEAINSLYEVIKACEYFKWDIFALVRTALNRREGDLKKLKKELEAKP